MLDQHHPKNTTPSLPDPRPVDVHVGQRLRQRRTLLGMSQERLGEAVNLTFQQIQKYERGANRIGASRLYQLANVLDVDVAYFFADMPSQVAATHGARADEDTAAACAVVQGIDPLARRETLELVRAYYAIPDPKVRAGVFGLVKSLTAGGEEERA